MTMAKVPPPIELTQGQHMARYYVYENWTHDRARADPDAYQHCAPEASPLRHLATCLHRQTKLLRVRSSTTSFKDDQWFGETANLVEPRLPVCLCQDN